MSDSVEVGNEFVHMLEHLADLEQRMLRELQGAVATGDFSGLAGGSGDDE